MTKCKHNPYATHDATLAKANAEAHARDERRKDEAEVEHRSVRLRLHTLLQTMQEMGECDMGWLDYDMARKFHKATALIRDVCASKGIAP